MRLKSYYVQTMEEALQAAKAELGEDAMLVGSKRLEGQPGSRTRLEVVFAAAAAAPPPPPKARAERTPTGDSGAELRRFRGELATLLDALSRSPDAGRLEPLTPARPQLDALRARLLAAEVPAAAIDGILARSRPELERFMLRGAGQMAEAESAVLALLEADGPRTAAGKPAPSRVVALAGPSGAGKTTAAAKLAFRLGVSGGQPVSVVSIDNLRVGASDHLAHVCALLGVPFQSLDSSGTLHATITGHRQQRGVILIDTPGYGAADGDALEETAEQLRRIDGLECHLVLPATLRYSEMRRKYGQFAPFAPERLLLTRLDEAEFFGPAWTFAAEAGLPVTWVTTGPGIAEGLEEADAGRFAAALLGQSPYLPKTREYTPRGFAASA
jgi:flagellar biosynthesis protein FlhF